MKAGQSMLFLLVSCTATSLCGCYVPKAQLTTAETQNRVLVQQNRAQLAEIENLKAHTHNTENQLLHTEQELAVLQEQTDLNRKRLANYQQATDQLHEQFKGLSSGRQLPAPVSKRLIDLSLRYPNLHFDPATGISKLDADVLFDSGQSELKPAARSMLTELGQILQSPDAKDLKIMVVGHTDNQRIAGKAIRDKFPSNFHLSTGRALAVADLLRGQGLSEQRIGVAGFGPHQPVVSNESPSDRPKNRRVEIFVMPPDVPVVGWTESIPGAYY